MRVNGLVVLFLFIVITYRADQAVFFLPFVCWGGKVKSRIGVVGG